MSESLPRFRVEDVIREFTGRAQTWSDLQFIVGRLDPQPLRYPAGTRIFNQGDEGDAMYFIVQGSVEVTYKDPAEDIESSLRIRVLSAPDVVGEMALVNNQPRSATVTSLDESLVYRLSRDNWRIIEESQPIMGSEIKNIAGRRAAELGLAIRIALQLNS